MAQDPNHLHVRHFATCDVFAELVVVVFPQRLDQLRNATLLDQLHLVVHVLKDEVSGGAGGKALNLLVVAVEQLHQLPDAPQTTHLEGQKVEIRLLVLNQKPKPRVLRKFWAVLKPQRYNFKYLFIIIIYVHILINSLA